MARSIPSRQSALRPVLNLSAVFLSDGRQAWPVAAAAGVCCRTFRARLRRNWSPDQAVLPVGAMGVGRRPAYGSAVLLPDGRRAWPVAKAAGVSSATFWHRLRIAGWPPEKAVQPVGVSRRGRRPALDPDIRLSDGRLALPVALAAGVSAAKFRGRVRFGMPADEAVKPNACYRLADGRPAVPVARGNGVSRIEFLRRIKAGQSPDQAVL